MRFSFLVAAAVLLAAPGHAQTPAPPSAAERAEAGMSTAEYAVGTIAAVAFAAVLIAVVKSATVRSALEGIISSALSTR